MIKFGKKEGVGMKKLLLIFMLVLSTVTFAGRSVQTYAYTEQQKQEAKAWLSAHGYAPTRAGAEQAYQDYKDGKIDIPEANEHLGRNKKKNTRENSSTGNNKKNTNVPKKENATTEKAQKKTDVSKKITKQKIKTTTTTEGKRTITETKQQEKKKVIRKQKGKKYSTKGVVSIVVFAVIAGFLVVMRKKK